jgi:hypothetical protein
MSNLKSNSTKIVLNGKEYGLRFTLNAVEDIQDLFDISIAELPKLLHDERNAFKNIKGILTILINEDIDCHNDESGEKLPRVDARFVGRQMNVSEIGTLSASIFSSFSSSAPEADEDEAPNAKSE